MTTKKKRGRPPSRIKRVSATFKLTLDVDQLIQDGAERLGLNRSQYVEQAIYLKAEYDKLETAKTKNERPSYSDRPI